MVIGSNNDGHFTGSWYAQGRNSSSINSLRYLRVTLWQQSGFDASYWRRRGCVCSLIAAVCQSCNDLVRFTCCQSGLRMWRGPQHSRRLESLSYIICPIIFCACRLTAADALWRRRQLAEDNSSQWTELIVFILPTTLTAMPLTARRQKLDKLCRDIRYFVAG